MLRFREMRSALEKAKTQGVSMQRRLVLYWFSMALAILAAVLLVVSLTGVFSNTAQKFGQSLTIQKHNTASALAGQMDQLTAQSIALSEELTRELDKQLAAGGRTFSALNDDPGAIAAVETALYPALNTYLKSSACSGAVFCLDATANTALPGAATSRAGLYLRYSALRAIGATDQHVTCFRGTAETARSAQVQMHNRWNPELNVQAVPGYTQLLRDLRQLPGVAVVEGVVFGDDARKLHESAPFAKRLLKLYRIYRKLPGFCAFVGRMYKNLVHKFYRFARVAP